MEFLVSARLLPVKGDENPGEIELRLEHCNGFPTGGGPDCQAVLAMGNVFLKNLHIASHPEGLVIVKDVGCPKDPADTNTTHHLGKVKFRSAAVETRAALAESVAIVLAALDATRIATRCLHYELRNGEEQPETAGGDTLHDTGLFHDAWLKYGPSPQPA